MEKQPPWHREAASARVVGTLQVLHQTLGLSGYYLAGGTALALHFGHRISEDLDLFAEEAFDEDALLQRVQSLKGFALVAKGSGTLHAHIGGTKVSFLSYSYPLLFPCPTFLEVQVADPRDIACMKLSAIASRGTRRDFIDLYAVTQRYELSHIFEWFKTKFAAASYSGVHLVKSLTYFEDAEKDPLPHMLVPLAWEEVKQFFARQAPLLLASEASSGNR